MPKACDCCDTVKAPITPFEIYDALPSDPQVIFDKAVELNPDASPALLRAILLTLFYRVRHAAQWDHDEVLFQRFRDVPALVNELAPLPYSEEAVQPFLL